MRKIRITAPSGCGCLVAETAFGLDINKISLAETTHYDSNGAVTVLEVFEIEPSNQKRKLFLETLFSERYFDPEFYKVELSWKPKKLKIPNHKRYQPIPDLTK